MIFDEQETVEDETFILQPHLTHFFAWMFVLTTVLLYPFDTFKSGMNSILHTLISFCPKEKCEVWHVWLLCKVSKSGVSRCSH